MADNDMRGGGTLHEQIEGAIRTSDKLIVVLSASSIESDWVSKEIAFAKSRESAEKSKVLFPIRITSMERLDEWEMVDSATGTDLAADVRRYFIPDFTEWKHEERFGDSLSLLVKSLLKTDEVVDESYLEG